MKGRFKMRLNAPKQMTWWISLILAIIAVVVHWFGLLTFLTPYGFIILLVGFVILWLGTFVKGF